MRCFNIRGSRRATLENIKKWIVRLKCSETLVTTPLVKQLKSARRDELGQLKDTSLVTVKFLK